MQACLVSRSKFSSKLVIFSVWLDSSRYMVSQSEGSLRTATQRERKVRDIRQGSYPGNLLKLIHTNPEVINLILSPIGLNQLRLQYYFPCVAPM